MNKKIKTIIIVITASVITLILFFSKRNMTAEYETDLYSVSYSIQWDKKNLSDDAIDFMIGNDRVASIETFRDCSYCTSAESIAVNVFGMHSSLEDVQETVFDGWTKYKMVIDYELSAAEQEQGETELPSEIHYIYTNKQDTFIDIYVNKQLLTEDEIQKFIDSVAINFVVPYN